MFYSLHFYKFIFIISLYIIIAFRAEAQNYSTDAPNIRNNRLQIGVIPSAGLLHFNKSNIANGYIVDILKQIYLSTNWAFDIIIIDPRHASIEEQTQFLLDEKFDMIFGILPTKRNQEQLLLTKPFIDLYLTYMTKNYQASQKQWPRDFISMRLSCVQWDYVACKHAKKFMKGPLSIYKNHIDAFEAIQLDLDDFTAVTNNIANYYHKFQQGQIVTINNDQIGTIPLTIGFPKNNEKIFNVMNALIDDILTKPWLQQKKLFWISNVNWVGDAKFDTPNEYMKTYENLHLTKIESIID